jgi:predicted thioesterase
MTEKKHIKKETMQGKIDVMLLATVLMIGFFDSLSGAGQEPHLYKQPSHDTVDGAKPGILWI